MLSTTLGRLRLVGFMEGLSYLILLGIAMPLKYFMDMPQAVQITGMAHGILFILYVLLVVLAAWQYKWSPKKTGLALLSSVLPFGPFVADAKLFKPQEESSSTTL